MWEIRRRLILGNPMAIPTPSSQEILDVLPASKTTWHMTLGAQVEPGGVRFRVWAPKRERVDVALEEDCRSFPLTKDKTGYFSGYVPIAKAGMSYRYPIG